MKTSMKTLLASASVLTLTVLHHFYGAALYATPWRHHVAVLVLPVLLVLIVAYGVHRRHPQTRLGRASLWLFIILTLVVPVGVIGIFEGGYNHLVKNALFFGGVPRATLEQLFPAPRYEMPDDLWFLVAELPRSGDGAEAPPLLAGADVEAPHVPGGHRFHGMAVQNDAPTATTSRQMTGGEETP